MADEIRGCADLDERLTPYIDGEDESAAHRAVEGHLSRCPPCREQASAESAARDLVRDHRHALCARASEHLRARCAAGAPTTVSGSRPSASGFRVAVRRWAPLSVAATLLLAVAGVFLSGLNDRVEALAASLAMDHVKCFKVNGTGTQAEPAAAARAWAQDQGWPIVVPPAEPAEDLRLLHVRRCFSTDGRAAHLMYAWRGEPLSVYVIQGEAGRDKVVDRMGTRAVVWCANQRTYAVVADDASRDLAPIVAYMKLRVR